MTGDQEERPNYLRGPVDYELAFPIVLTLKAPAGRATDRTIDRVTVHRPKGKHLDAMDRAGVSSMAQAKALIGPLCGLTEIEVKEMDLVDIAAIAEIIGSFLPPGLGTGATD